MGNKPPTRRPHQWSTRGRRAIYTEYLHDGPSFTRSCPPHEEPWRWACVKELSIKGEERTKGTLNGSHQGAPVSSPFTCVCQMHNPGERLGGFCTTGIPHADWLSSTEILAARLILHFPPMSGLISGWPLTHTYWILQPWKMPFYWHLGICGRVTLWTNGMKWKGQMWNVLF